MESVHSSRSPDARQLAREKPEVRIPKMSGTTAVDEVKGLEWDRRSMIDDVMTFIFLVAVTDGRW